MASGYLVTSHDTRALPSQQGADFWREHTTLNHGSLDFAFADPAAFWGRTVVQRSGEHQVVEFCSGEVAYVRTPRHARADDDRSLRIVVVGSGRILLEGARTSVTVRPGRAAVLGMDTAFALRHAEGTHAWILSLPERAWPTSLTPDQPRAVDVDAGVGAIAVSMLHGLTSQRSSLQETDFVELNQRIGELVATCAGRQVPVGPAGMEAAARQLARTRAGDPDFTPARLAGELGWSLRQVQACLRRAGTTPADVIRGVRLERAHAQLSSPARLDTHVSDIAHDCGFGSLSGFNAAFREAYGLAPRDVRPDRPR